ncbi:MAG: chloride channel protein [Chitinophagaceae bacterium]|jgi:CIC family chloride channel protein|nr:chloride channel protein [Chitinophagaceae bacterium]
MSCILVGASASLAAVVLKLFAFRIEQLFFAHAKLDEALWYQSLMPIAGIGLSGLLVVKFFNKNFLKGNDTIVYAIAKKSSNLPFSQIYSHIITSGITVGLGGSAGMESPMVATGAAIGSNYGRANFLPYKEKTLLLACGVASGISSAFSAPIAGVLFALEVLMIDITITSFIPLLISAATGALIAKIILGGQILLSFQNIQPFNSKNTFIYILIGLATGVSALYYARVYEWVGQRFISKFTTPLTKWMAGAGMLAVLIFFFPPLFGEGYQVIKLLAENNSIEKRSFLIAHVNNEWILLAFTVAMVLLKVFATAFTIQGGGNGGSFAPALFIGALIGFIVAKLCVMAGYQDVPFANFIVVGMAGMLSGLFFAPLTAIFLSAEITNGYSLFIPLMIVAAISFFVVKSFEPLSMEMKKLSLHTKLNPSNKDAFLLSKLELRLLINSNYPCFNMSAGYKEIMTALRSTNKEVYAVTDDNKKLTGVIYLNDLKSVLLSEDDDEYKNVTAGDLMSKPPTLFIDDDIESALSKFEQLNISYFALPVIDKESRWVGFIVKSAILEKYREEIIRISYN